MMPISTAELGMTHGVRTFQTGNVPDNTPGTGTTRVNGGNRAVGSILITWDGGGSINVGDVITFGSNGTRYMVTQNASAATFRLDRPLEEAIVDNDTIHKLQVENSVMFHPDCLTFAMRSPSAGNTATEEVFTDPRSGISLRLQAIRQENQTKYQLDCMWGWVTHRDDAAVLIRA